MTEDARLRTVVVGLLGSTLDQGAKPKRWDRWRPSVALFQYDDLLIDRFELLYQRRYAKLVHTVVADIESLSPHTEVVPVEIALPDPWDFEGVFETLHRYAQQRVAEPDAEDLLVHITTGSHVAQICLFLLTEARYFPGRLIQGSPPRRRTAEPASYRIIDLDLSRYDSIATRFAQESDDAQGFLKFGVATRSEAFNRLIAQLERVAIATHDPLLLTGATGTGKTRLARRIYELKRARHRLDGRFVEINCATLRGDAAMSALFGHVRGAFTGAERARQGLLRAADGGMLFLDEIGELGLDEQAMLLHALETGRFLPVGSDDEVESNFQLIAGTHRELAMAVAEGRFREDLLARINLWTFRLPSLAERREDIEPNLAFELDAFAQRTGQQVSFNAEGEARFLDFATSGEALWRANFRDLNAAVTRMATLAHGGRIGPEDVAEERLRLTATWKPAQASRTPGEQRLIELLGEEGVAELDRFDRVQLADVVAVCLRSSSISAAGRALFAVSRKKKKSNNDADRLRKYLARFGLRFQDLVESLS